MIEDPLLEIIAGATADDGVIVPTVVRDALRCPEEFYDLLLDNWWSRYLRYLDSEGAEMRGLINMRKTLIKQIEKGASDV